MNRASPREKDYFRRVGSQNRALPHDEPPRSLADMFERLAKLERQLGALAKPGRSGTSAGDLDSHLQYLKRIRSLDHAHRA